MEMTAERPEYYDKERPHSAFGYQSPEMYRGSAESPMVANVWCDFSAPPRVTPDVHKKEG